MGVGIHQRIRCAMGAVAVHAGIASGLGAHVSRVLGAVGLPSKTALVTAAGGRHPIDRTPGGARLRPRPRAGPDAGIGSHFDTSLIEEHVFLMANHERGSRGRPPVGRSARIDAVARGHSRDMAERGFYSHLSPEGMGPADRMEQAGLDLAGCSGVWENIHMVPTYRHYWDTSPPSYSYYGSEREIAVMLLAGWMASRGHRENVLLSSHVLAGIGVHTGPDGYVYATQNFCNGTLVVEGPAGAGGPTASVGLPDRHRRGRAGSEC